MLCHSMTTSSFCPMRPLASWKRLAAMRNSKTYAGETHGPRQTASHSNLGSGSFHARSSKEQQDDRVRLLKDELVQSEERIAEFRRWYEGQTSTAVSNVFRENLDNHIGHNRRLTDENETLRRDLEKQERQRRHGR